MTEATKRALEELETRLRSEFEKSRIANREANRAELEKSRIANRASIEALEKTVRKLQKGRNKNSRTIEAFIYLTRMRENVRMVEMFFNELYKEWVKSEWPSKTHMDGWRHNTQLRLDYEEYPAPEKSFATRKDRIEAFSRDKKSTEEAEFRRKRAIAFLRSMWAGFGGNDSINLSTWLDLTRFVKQTNDACHATASWVLARSASNVVEEHRSNPPRVNTDSIGNFVTKIIGMVNKFGGSRWTHAAAKACAIENRKLFAAFPEGAGWR